MKNNNCCCRFLLFVIVCVMSVNLHAQSDSLLQNSDLKRKQFRLAIDVPNNEEDVMLLKKEQLQTMLLYEQFRNYRISRNCFVASIPLLSLGVGLTAFGGTIIFFIGNKDHLAGKNIGVLLAIGTGITFLTSGITLISCSAIKLNSIAENYNKQRHHSYFQNGLQLNYGFVGNGIGVNLKF